MLLAMVTNDTPENGRTALTHETLKSLARTVDWSRHRLMISDNNSCRETHELYPEYRSIIERVILNGSNIGTANAINRVWSYRKPNEHVVKLDNDVVIHQPGWANLMEEVFARDRDVGICGLKRKDLQESPSSSHEFYHSTLEMVPHTPGERWIVVENVRHVFGTCQGYSGPLLREMGYLVQPSVYGFDDALASVRAHAAGFKTVFLHGIEIDHIDPGGTNYTEWKRDQAQQYMQAYHRMRDMYETGTTTAYHDGGALLKNYQESLDV